MTFSIAAYDPEENVWGIAVASKFLAVGAVVSWARAGAGAVATQSFAKVSFGSDGLNLMADGMSASDTLEKLLAADPARETRQVGIVDAKGGAAAHTGQECFNWAGHRIGAGFTCQGNILASQAVIDALAETFEGASGELADRLVTALLAGDDAGGDRRGKQGAAVLVVRAGAGYGGDNDRYLDLRVDDDPEPVKKLSKLVTIHHVFFRPPRPEDQLIITPDIARELQFIMRQGGYFQTEPDGEWNDTSKRAFRALIGNENLEERWSLDKLPDSIDRVVLAYLRQRFGN